MKKLLLLGGSSQQIIAIETAKKHNFYTILCDYLEDNPGQYVADCFYLVSTTDKEAILEVAKKEKIDGIIAYASDPAAPTAAYVAETLGLPTNPYSSVNTLCNKDLFRDFLKKNGYNAPEAKSFSRKEDVDITGITFPVIVKPVDSSGSKGATVLENEDSLQEAIDLGFSYSRSHRIIIEEFIQKKHPYLIGGDIFVLNGKIISYGLLNCHRDVMVNDLVPVGKSYPLQLADQDIEKVKKTLDGIVENLGFKFGPINVELVVDKQNRVWPIDIGPRAGGNMIPDLLTYINHVNFVEMSVLACMGVEQNVICSPSNIYIASHNLHSNKSGKYQGITFSKDIEKYIIKKSLYKKEGDEVHFFSQAACALGIIFLKFDSFEELDGIISHVNDYYKVHLK